ncbi:ABC transporter ATP-binding protein [Candidatus Uhrbacteria bacterium]|jgi:ABC-2 type transport system ATP-binding protein|nr:ABC transporter ATP-binding protein [Candidatus Uhrbacteria bacterium]
MNALEILHLTKEYGSNVAVDDLSFTVKKGQFFGFLGPNGAGKSTTINCITGVSRYVKGDIKLFGIDVNKDYRKARRLVGLAPQEFNAEIFASTEKILDYMGGYYGMRKDERAVRVDELIEQFGMNEHRKKQFRELSGGMKRRVMLMRALIHDPDLLILDEPTAGVDVELRHELWDHLRDLNKKGKTILLTSHYLEEVELLCDTVVIMNKGKIAETGTVKDLTKDGTLEKRYLQLTKDELGD